VTTLYGQALTDPNRTARIKSWCVSIDGSRLTTNAAIYESVGYTRNDLNFAAAFSPEDISQSRPSFGFSAL